MAHESSLFFISIWRYYMLNNQNAFPTIQINPLILIFILADTKFYTTFRDLVEKGSVDIPEDHEYCQLHFNLPSPNVQTVDCFSKFIPDFEKSRVGVQAFDWLKNKLLEKSPVDEVHQEVQGLV